MTARRTWIWVVVGLGALVVVTIVAIAGAGVYFVSNHIQTDRSTSAEAVRAFDAARVALGTARPLFEVDGENEPHLVQPLTSLPTSQQRPNDLCVLAWDPERERLIRVSLPLWMLRFGKHRMSILRGDRGFDLERLDLDPRELERIGPALLFDLRHQDGVRVLLWTQ